jgi:uncharacterized RDD family membrane protein YckC
MAAGGRKRRPKPGAADGGKLERRRPEAGQLPVLAEERRSEETGVVGRKGDGHTGAQQGENGVSLERESPGGVVRREADVERDAGTSEVPDERRVAGGPDTVGDSPGSQPAKGAGDRIGPSDLPGVDDGGQAEPGQTPVDRSEVARGKGQLIPAEAEADRPRPGVPRVEVQDAVSRVGTEVPDGVEKDPDAAVPAALVPGEDRLDRVPYGRPLEPEPLDDGGGDVDLGVRDPFPAEAGRQIPGQEREVLRPAKQAADVAVEGEEIGKAVEPAPGANGGEVGEEGRAGAPREADESRGAHRPLEVEVELGLRPEAEGSEGLGGIHAGPSYGTLSRDVFTVVPAERLWLRAAALGLDLICLAGGPLLVATLVVFLVVLLAAEPPVGLPWVFRAAQLLFVVLFLLRDARGASPGKLLLGLSVAREGGGRVRPLDSVLRNLPLLVPGLNLLEAVAVVKRPDSRRLGDRLAATTVGES